MILIPQGRKILIIAASLFVSILSLLFIVVGHGDTPIETSQLKTSVFENLLHKSENSTIKDEEESQNSSLPSVTVDRNGLVITTNNLFEDAFGFSSAELKNKTFLNLLDSDDLVTFAQDFAHEVSSEKIVVNSGPYSLIDADESAHVVLITFEPRAISSSKNSQEFVLSIKDISSTVQSEKKSIKSNNIPAKGKKLRDQDTGDIQKDEPKIIVDKTS